MFYKCILLVITIFLGHTTSYSQSCPFTEADFEDGGSFSGTCTLEVGSSATISGTVLWTGGTLTLVNAGGGSGNLFVSGSLTIQSGATVLVTDEGRFGVNSGGSMLIDGTLITSGNGSDHVVAAGGSLTSSGTLTIGGDLVVNGGTVLISGGTFEIDRNPDGDLEVYNGGSFTVSNGANVIVEDDISNTCNDAPCTGTASQATIVIEGHISLGGDIAIVNTTPNSALTGASTGVIEFSAPGTFSDGECATYPNGTFAFCGCTGTGVCASSMPIELISFEAFQNHNIVTLEWETATEINNDYFTIERLTSTDEFESLVVIPGSGTTHETKKYSTTDNHPNEGKNYYRLKQTDYDGKFSTSEVKMVEFKKNEYHLKIYPNPTEVKKCEIEIGGLQPEQPHLIVLKTALGHRVFSALVQSNTVGKLKYELAFDHVPSGFYLVEVAGKVAKVFVK